MEALALVLDFYEGNARAAVDLPKGPWVRSVRLLRFAVFGLGAPANVALVYALFGLSPARVSRCSVQGFAFSNVHYHSYLRDLFTTLLSRR